MVRAPPLVQVAHLSNISGLQIKLPADAKGAGPNMSTAKPHRAWPVPACGKVDLFCDGFDTAAGEVRGSARTIVCLVCETLCSLSAVLRDGPP